MVQIDAAELEELERVIMALTEEAEKAEARVDQLHKVPVRDVLKFIIGNSDSANVTITEAGVADEALSKLPTTSGMGSYRPSQSGMKSGSYCLLRLEWGPTGHHSRDTSLVDHACLRLEWGLLADQDTPSLAALPEPALRDRLECPLDTPRVPCSHV